MRTHTHTHPQHPEYLVFDEFSSDFWGKIPRLLPLLRLQRVSLSSRTFSACGIHCMTNLKGPRNCRLTGLVQGKHAGKHDSFYSTIIFWDFW